MKKQIILLSFIFLLCGCNAPIKINTPTKAPQITEAPPTEEPVSDGVIYDRVEINEESQAGSMTKVASFDAWILSEDTPDEITLYTSAEKHKGKFEWDDSAEWLLEIHGSDEKYYTLFHERVSLGSIYFDVAEFDEKPYILLRNISTANNYTKVFCIKDDAYCLTNELNLNDLSEHNVNLLYTSTPTY